MSLLKISQVSTSSTGSNLLFATSSTGAIYKRTGYPTTYNNVTTTTTNTSTAGVTLNTTRVDEKISNCVATKSGSVVTVACTLPVVLEYTGLPKTASLNIVGMSTPLDSNWSPVKTG